MGDVGISTKSRWDHKVEFVAATVFPFVIRNLLLSCQLDEQVLVHSVEALRRSQVRGFGNHHRKGTKQVEVMNATT